MAIKDNGLTTGHVLLPLTIVAFALCGLIGFQSSVILGEHQAFLAVKKQQEKPLEQAKKVQGQVLALAEGTQKLAHEGDKNAEAIIARLKQLGITVNQPVPGATPGAGPAPTDAVPAPAAP